jgi:hypothetical protein
VLGLASFEEYFLVAHVRPSLAEPRGLCGWGLSGRISDLPCASAYYAERLTTNDCGVGTLNVFTPSGCWFSVVR